MQAIKKPNRFIAIGPYPWLILCFFIKSIQKGVVSYDGFFGGPESMLSLNCLTSLEDYFYSNSVQPLHIGFYYALDSIFVLLLVWTIIRLYKDIAKYLDISPAPFFKKGLFGVCFLFLFAAIFSNVVGFNHFLDYYTDWKSHSKSIQREVLNIDNLNLSILLERALLGLMLFFLLVFFLYYNTIYQWRQTKKDEKRKKDEQEKRKKRGDEENEDHTIRDIFLKVVMTFSITIALGILLATVDQGQLLIYNLVQKPSQFFIALVLFLLMGWMTLFNPYYVNLDLYRNNQFAIPTTNKWTYPFGNSFDWSSIEAGDLEVQRMLKSTNSKIALWQRISILAQSWFAIAVLCSVAAKIIYLETFFLILVFATVPISVILSLVIIVRYGEIAKHESVLEGRDLSRLDIEKDAYGNVRFVKRMKFLMTLFATFLVIALMISGVLFFLQGDSIPDDKRLAFSIFLMVSINILLSILLVTRRKIALFHDIKRIHFRGLVEWVSNDRIGRIAQLVVSGFIVIAGLFFYYIKPDWIYHINPIITIFSFIIVLFFFFQSAAAHKTQLLVSDKISRTAKWVHVSSRVVVIFIIGMWFYNTFLRSPLRHVIPLVEKYEKQALSDSSRQDSNTLLGFIENLPESGHYYMVANEGGGLRANLWSMMVLNALDSISNYNFYNHVIATCGASGGAVGQGLFHLHKNRSTLDQRRHKFHKAMNNISKTDFLSRDMFSLLYERQVAMLYPLTRERYIDQEDCNRRGDMVQANKYASLIHDIPLKESLRGEQPYHKSIEQWWHEARMKNQYGEHHFPLPIMHGANVETGREGVVCPLSDASDIFNGVHVINDDRLIKRSDSCGIPDKVKSISFLDGLFLANRFPLMSPIAIIPGKGNYNDAGSFDNTGISSLMDIMYYLEQKATLSQDTQDTTDIEKRYIEAYDKIKGKITLIIIQNSQEAYAHEQFKQWEGQLDGVNTYENLTSNFKSATNTGAVKEYLHKVAEKHEGVYFKEVVYLNMPYLILGKHNVDGLFNGQVASDQGVWKMIDTFNKYKIDTTHKLQKKIYFKPPLGRVINKSVYKFMRTEIDSSMVPVIQDIVNPIK